MYGSMPTLRKSFSMFVDNWVSKDLSYRREFFKAFEKSGNDFSKLDALGWAYILCVHPELADRCDWEMLNKDESGDAWHCLLIQQPQFADRCEWRFASRWNDPHGDEWSAGRWHWDTLLVRHPQFADKCDWSVFRADDLEFMAENKKLIDYFNLSSLNEACWVRVLCNRPEFESECDWSLLTGTDWADLLLNHPQFAKYCSWEKLDALDWGKLLHGRPQFVDCCAWDKLTGTDWGKLLSKAPEFAERCNWSKLDKKGWQWLVYSHAEFKVELEKYSDYKYAQLEDESCEWYEEEIGIF